jgi:serine/threonine protein phosphatase PrpC
MEKTNIEDSFITSNPVQKEEQSQRDLFFSNGKKAGFHVNKSFSLSFSTKSGKSDLGERKINQDSILILNNIFGLENFHIFGILDGHGDDGHLISSYTKNFLISYFTCFQIYNIIINKEDKGPEVNLCQIDSICKEESPKVTENYIYEKLTENNYFLIKQSYILAEENLGSTNFKINFSGTTCIMMIMIGSKLICSNVGDSRAILIDENDEDYQFVKLSRDHKPEIKSERIRIENMGGVIKRSKCIIIIYFSK